MVVDAESVDLCIAVEDEAPLEEGVRRRFNAGDEAAGGEGRLLHIAVVVLGIAVDDDAAEGVEGAVLVVPALGGVEGVDVVGLRLLVGHGLHVPRPLSGATVLDVLPQVALGKVGVLKQATTAHGADSGESLREAAEQVTVEG